VAVLERVLDAGARVLAERGFHGTTMRDVARAAGTSVGILYHYLDGKEDLLYRVAFGALEAAVASAEAVHAVAGAMPRLKALVTDHIRRGMTSPAEAEVMRSAPGPLRRERARRLEEMRTLYLERVGAVVDAVARRAPRGKATGSRAALLLAMADHLAREGSKRRPQPSPSRLAAEAVTVFLHGIRG
jgi:AcrR family transcriptional regulator